MSNVIEIAIINLFITGFGNPFIVAVMFLLLFGAIGSVMGMGIELMAWILVPASMYLFVSFIDVNVHTMIITLAFIVLLVIGIAFARLMRN